MNRVYQNRKQRQLAKKESWNAPFFSNKDYYDNLAERGPRW